MKKLLSLLLVLTLLAGLAACGSEQTGNSETAVSETSAQSVSPSPSETTEATSSASSAPEASPSPSSEAPEAVSDEPSPTYTVTYPLVEETVTMTLLHMEPAMGPLTGRVGIENYGDLESFQVAVEETGIDIDWIQMSMMAASETFNLTIASGSYPDMIASVGNYYSGGFTKALDDEVILDLTELIPIYAPDYYAYVSSEASLARNYKDDEGRMLGIYGTYNYAIFNEGSFIRQDWLDSLGIDKPTTYDQLHDALSAVQSELGVAHPMYFNRSCMFLSQGYGIEPFDTYTGTLSMYQVDGVIQCPLTADAYRDYLTMLHQWYTEGLLNPNFIEVSNDTMSGEIESMLASDEVAVWQGMITTMPNYYSFIEDPNLSVEGMIVTVDGGNDHISYEPPYQDAICVSTQCQSPELAISWLNYWYTEPGIALYNYGVEGLHYELVDGEYQFTEMVLNNNLGVDPTLFLRTITLSGASFGQTVQERVYGFYQPYQTEAINYWSEHIDSTYALPALSYTTAESETIARLATDITTYAAEMVPKFIIGDEPLSEWDNYIANIENMSLQELVDIYQAAYNRYLSR